MGRDSPARRYGKILYEKRKWERVMEMCVAKAEEHGYTVAKAQDGAWIVGGTYIKSDAELYLFLVDNGIIQVMKLPTYKFSSEQLAERERDG